MLGLELPKALGRRRRLTCLLVTRLPVRALTRCRTVDHRLAATAPVEIAAHALQLGTRGACKWRAQRPECSLAINQEFFFRGIFEFELGIFCSLAIERMSLVDIAIATNAMFVAPS